MVTTVVYSKKVFLKVMEELLKDDEFVVISNIIDGSISAGTKKKYLRVSVGFNQYSFIHPNSIVDVMNSKVFGLIVCKKELLAKELQKEDDEVKE
jgi:predicted nucleic acid-binding protein